MGNKNKAILRWFAIFVALAPLAPLVFTKHGWDPTHLPQILYLTTGTLLFTTIWFYRGIASPSLIVKCSSLGLPLLIMLLWAAISQYWAINRYYGFQILLQWSIAGLGFFLMSQWVENEDDVLWILQAILSSGVVLALIGIGQYWWQWDFVDQTIAPAATFSNKNMAAEYMVMIMPLGIALFLGSQLRRISLWWLSATLVIILFLFFTFTKAAWLAMAGQAVMMLLLVGVYVGVGKRRSQSVRGHSGPPEEVTNRAFLAQNFRKKLGLIGVAGILILILANMTPTGFNWAFGRALDVVNQTVSDYTKGRPSTPASTPQEPGKRQTAVPLSSLWVRLSYWFNTLELIKDFPVKGVGLGNFRIHYPRYANALIRDPTFSEKIDAQQVHNDYLNIVADLGIIGGLITLWGAITLLIIWLRLAKKIEGLKNPGVFWGITIGMLGFFITAGFGFPLYRMVPTYLLGCLLGCSWRLSHQLNHAFLAPGKEALRGEMPSFVLPGLGRWSGFIVFGFLFVVSLFAGNNLRKADIHYGRMSSFDKFLVNPQQVFAEAKLVARYSPFNNAVYFFMGKSLFDLGKTDESIPMLELYRHYDPYSLSNLLNLAMAYFATNQFSQASAICDEILNNYPENGFVYSMKALIATAQNDLVKAYRFYQITFSLGVDKYEVYYNYGNVCMNLQRYREAKEAFVQCLKMHPYPSAYQQLGLIQLNYLEEFAEGKANLQKALELTPDPGRREEIKAQLKFFGY